MNLLIHFIAVFQIFLLIKSASGVTNNNIDVIFYEDVYFKGIYILKKIFQLFNFL